MEDIALTPFAHTTGLYFNPDPEPQDKEYLIYKDIVDESRKEGNAVVEMGYDAMSYYDAMMKSKQRLHDNFKISKKRDPNLIYIKIDSDDDRMI